MAQPIPKPIHLTAGYAAQFQDPGVARAYRYRPPYPNDLVRILLDLIGPGPRTVLDLGTGDGSVARPLSPFVDRIDAIDFSLPMLDLARTLPNGDHPNIRWIHAPAETAALNPPYGLATAGSSLHWMDWHIVLPRVKAALAAGGYLAIFDEQSQPLPWSDALNQLIPRYSTNQDFRPYRLLDELSARNLFQPAGRIRTASMPFAQSIADHVESMHSRNGFSRDRMPAAAAAAFDRQFESLLHAHCPNGVVKLEVFTEITYGIPAPRLDRDGAEEDRHGSS